MRQVDPTKQKVSALMLTSVDLDRFIALNPAVLGGKPCIAGRRIRVVDVAFWHEKLGWSADTIASKHNLTLAEVHAALAYYYDHRTQLDAELQADEAFVNELKQRIPGRFLGATHERTD
jgi:uncharacterized protein (DUF433 family)